MIYSDECCSWKRQTNTAGVINSEDILTDLRRITRVTDLPVLVDIDAGFGSSIAVARTVRDMEAVRSLILGEHTRTLGWAQPPSSYRKRAFGSATSFVADLECSPGRAHDG